MSSNRLISLVLLFDYYNVRVLYSKAYTMVAVHFHQKKTKPYSNIFFLLQFYLYMMSGPYVGVTIYVV